MCIRKKKDRYLCKHVKQHTTGPRHNAVNTKKNYQKQQGRNKFYCQISFNAKPMKQPSKKRNIKYWWVYFQTVFIFNVVNNVNEYAYLQPTGRIYLIERNFCTSIWSLKWRYNNYKIVRILHGKGNCKMGKRGAKKIESGEKLKQVVKEIS